MFDTEIDEISASTDLNFFFLENQYERSISMTCCKYIFSPGIFTFMDLAHLPGMEVMSLKLYGSSTRFSLTVLLAPPVCSYISYFLYTVPTAELVPSRSGKIPCLPEIIGNSPQSEIIFRELHGIFHYMILPVNR
jgi:hypothetical protein